MRGLTGRQGALDAGLGRRPASCVRGQGSGVRGRGERVPPLSELSGSRPTRSAIAVRASRVLRRGSGGARVTRLRPTYTRVFKATHTASVSYQSVTSTDSG